MDFLNTLWGKHPSEILLGLTALNLVLGIYILKNILSFKKVGNRSQKIREIRLFARMGESTPLYEIKKLVDEEDDVVALYAFRAMLQHSNAVNITMLKKIVARSAKKQFLLASCITKVARGNPKVIQELLDDHVGDNVYVYCLKALAKTKSPDLLPILLKAQENTSERVHTTASELLNKISTPQQAAS